MKKFIIPALAMLALCNCGGSQNKNNDTAQSSEKSKSLVVYYSQSGATKQLAEVLCQKLNADLDSIVCVEPYDGDFQSTIARCQKEMAEQIVTTVKPLSKNVADYDTIYLGYPVWFGISAMPVAGFLKDNDLNGKVLVPFCTFGSGGLATSINNLKESLANVKIENGYGIRNARIQKASMELDTFLVNNGYKKGEVVKLSELSEQQPVNDDDIAVFQDACMDYPMPLGTPITVAKRDIEGGQEYVFVVENNQPNNSSKSKIIVHTHDGEKADFIQAIR